ncbi:MAG: hypothetical protein M0D57_10625 [Sphingobacteriales bacterium JAD_PAG50586_3]|nr:MAG: hypothetical protein M0D57_10625 [Sphingobacteriales bacterium JAD_PAG50586_3]
MKQQSTFKLDPQSDRYRICPYCKNPHMVVHRNADFCNRKCANDFHNRNKKIAKELSALLGPLEPSAVTEESTISIVPVLTPSQVNIQIFDSFEIEPGDELEVHFDELEIKGFDFDGKYASGRGNLFNMHKKYNGHYTQYGRYKTFRTDFSKLLIYKEN